MKKLVLFLMFSLVFLLCGTLQAGPTYSGSLATDFDSGNSTGADGLLEGTGGWGTGVSFLEWTVSLNGSWHYEYTLTVPDGSAGGGGISHMIIETSNPFDTSNIWNVSWTGTTDVGDDFGQGGSNPGIPGDIYGLKFDDISPEGSPDVLVFLVSFDSNRNPMWGDFYSKDGVVGGGDRTPNAVWNEGFLTSDPIFDPQNGDGTVLNHVIVPDTTIIPAPGAILLGSIGVGLVGWLRRRRTL